MATKSFKVLDVFFYRGHSLTSKIVRFLTSVRYGIPFKDAYSHVALGYDDVSTISAEAKGTMIVPNSEIETTSKSDVFIYRFKNLSIAKIEQFYDIAPSYIGRGYAFARYGLDAARIFSFVILILLLVFGWISFKATIGALLFIALLQAAIVILRKMDKKTSDCAELTAILLQELKLMPYFSSQPRNEFPNSQLAKMEMMSWYDLAELIAHWDYKTKSWQEVRNNRVLGNNFLFLK